MAIKLKELILSEENIYNAIYALESYISERDLLDKKDLNRFLRLRDKYDFKGCISETIQECQNTLKQILTDEDFLFDVRVYFKIKKLGDSDNPSVEYRPLHTSSLTNQICMAAMLIPLMFDDSTGKRTLSELSRMLPHNFYGNIPSCNVQSIFMNWTEKYRQYSQIVNNKGREYSRTREYDKEISFDLKDFFPSINPKKILNFIWNAISGKYEDKEDNQTLLTVITKLLYFKIPEDNLTGWLDAYYKDKGNITPTGGFYPSRGIAQGLPQSYFFGNLCMIDVAGEMNKLKELDKTDSYFYVDDSVVFARNVEPNHFASIIDKLNKKIVDRTEEWKKEPVLNKAYADQAFNIEYKVEFHTEGKSSICNIEDSFKGMDGLFLVQRPISMGGWIKGNIDEVDDNVAFKKLDTLQEVVDNQIKQIKKFLSEHNSSEEFETRLKWLRRYRRYFLFRKRKLQIILNGEYDKNMSQKFLETFKVEEVRNLRTEDGVRNDENAKNLLSNLFDIFEEDIFKSEFELLAQDMSLEDKAEFCDQLSDYDEALSLFNHEARNPEYLYYHKISSTLRDSDFITVDGYESLSKMVRKIRPFRSSERFINILKIKSVDTDESWKSFSFLKRVIETQRDVTDFNPEREFPHWCSFIFHNSENFKRKILNCCFSFACNILSADNLSILRSDIKPVKYYELRTITMLRNSRIKISKFFEFLRSVDCSDINERMDIDLGILEALGIFRQKVQEPEKIDRLIQTHRLVKSLWHNGSKFLNAYTLHNQEHAINLIKNVIRLVNDVDFLNLKSNDFFLLFNACYLHDISMVIHPAVATFNDPNSKSEQLISKWLRKMIELNQNLDHAFKYDKLVMSKVHLLRKDMGLKLVEIFQDVFDFFEDRVRSPHAHESARLIRNWQDGMLSYLSELEAEAIAAISDSHGWDISDVYEIKSAAKEELVSLKYMMILIRLADLLDLANDRIDYFLLKQNRSQMNSVSRYHWISHLITDKYELDVDFDVEEEAKLTEYPIKENIHLDIFLNSEILYREKVNREPCRGIRTILGNKKQERYPDNSVDMNCLVFQVGMGDNLCDAKHCEKNGDSRLCPFLCLWMSDKHKWLFSELGKLKHYLNSVNSKLIKSDIDVRFFFDNVHKLDSEFFDDVKNHLIK
ncbi:MAG: hypothetical protein NC453_16340 [Muribaculum sp.]|nr:hypothetical protein [Muribaculum sp.]